MNKKPLTIYLVDDDELFRMMISANLSDNCYSIREFDSGEACLANLEVLPDLILLDIEMSRTNGIETCRQIRSAGHNDVQIIFITSHNDLDTLLMAYASGGNDVIQKDAPKELLLLKIASTIQLSAQKKHLKAQIDNAHKTAVNAISNLGDTAILLEFLRTSFSCERLQQLGELIGDVLKGFNIQGLVRLYDDFGEYDFGSDTRCTPLEQSILSYVAKMGRVLQYQDRLILNYPHITILIFELDLNDLDSIGRLRDSLAIMAEGASVRIDAMSAEKYKLSNAKQVAYTAMSSLGETGVMLQFLRSSFGCENIQQLGSLIVEVLHQFNLTGLLRLASAVEECDFGIGMACTTAVSSQLNHAAQTDTISQVENRLTINYPHTTIVIINIENDNPEVIGRLRDNLAIIAEGTGVRIDAMNIEQQRLTQLQRQLSNIKELNTVFEEVEQHQKNNRSQFEQLIAHHSSEMEDAFLSLGLTDAQESRLHNTVKHLTQEMEKLFINDHIVSRKLHETIDRQKEMMNT